MKKLNQDELSKFIANELLKIGNYNFDLFYDIDKIVERFNASRGIHEAPMKETFYLMLRDTGSDLIDSNDENYSIYKLRSSTIYKLIFCWNYGYFYNECFCEVTKLNN